MSQILPAKVTPLERTCRSLIGTPQAHANMRLGEKLNADSLKSPSNLYHRLEMSTHLALSPSGRRIVEIAARIASPNDITAIP
jgi:hypothetical protein